MDITTNIKPSDLETIACNIEDRSFIIASKGSAKWQIIRNLFSSFYLVVIFMPVFYVPAWTKGEGIYAAFVSILSSCMHSIRQSHILIAHSRSFVFGNEQEVHVCMHKKNFHMLSLSSFVFN